MKVKFVLGYAADTVSEPLLYRLVKDYDIRVNILRAQISSGQEGNLLVEMDCADEDRLRLAIAWIESLGVSCVPVSKRLFWNEERCIDCGGCSGVCPSGALSLDRNEWKLVVDRERCTACGLCVTTCPMGCFTLDFGE